MGAYTKTFCLAVELFWREEIIPEVGNSEETGRLSNFFNFVKYLVLKLIGIGFE